MNFYIFLDIDGVLDNENYWWKCFNKHHVKGIMSCDYWPLDPKCLFNLMKLYQYIQKQKYKPKIILTSTWRLSKTSTEIVKCRLAEYGMVLYSSTPNINGVRGEEIVSWLSNNNLYTNTFIVIDDEIKDILQYIKKDKIIQTTFKKGFNKKCLNLAKQSITKQIKEDK